MKWRKVKDGKIMNKDMLQYMAIINNFNKNIWCHIDLPED